jgi:microcompartment protein CcmK/EutM
VSREDRKVLISSGSTARNTRLAFHQAALSAMKNPLDSDTEPNTQPVKVDLANTGEDLKLAISSGNRARQARAGFMAAGKATEDASTDIKPFDEDEGEASKRNTFGR